MLKINELNWTFCQFTHDDCLAIINQGGDLGPDGDVIDLYYVNVLKMDPEFNAETNVLYKEIYQKSFTSLQLAISEINTKFSNWKFVNLLDEQLSKSGGCGSCVAH